MLYGENKVDINALKQWSQTLSMNCVYYHPTSPMYQALNLQLNAFQRIILQMQPGSDWRDANYLISNMFMSHFFKVRNDAIRIANFYECFVIPADIYTKKKITEGYADGLTFGEVQLYDDREQIGSIGTKSDIIWSIFYEFFIVETQRGAIYHTLSNHEEFMSLQLWNTNSRSNDDVNEYIQNILLQVALEQGMTFKRINPSELWKEIGCAKTYGIQLHNEKYETIPLAYLNYGLTCDDSRMAYLHLYQVLEYFFIRAQNFQTKLALQDSGFLSTGTIDDNELRKILKNYVTIIKERESLKIVLQQSVRIPWLKGFITNSPDRISQYTIDNCITNCPVLNLDASDERIINRLSERIYFFRCAIAHAKGDIDEYIAVPLISAENIAAELPLLKQISFNALRVWGR